MPGRPAGVNPKLWGRAAWSLLYMSAVKDPSGILTASLMKLYASLLPCASCRRFTRQYVRAYGIGHQNPFDAVYLLHKTVACKIDACIPPKRDLLERYCKFGPDVSNAAVSLFLSFVKQNAHARNKTRQYSELKNRVAPLCKSYL